MKRIVATILCLCSMIGLLSGCASSKDAYIPTGDALVMENGQTINQPEEQISFDQALTLTYYPNITLNPYNCTDYTNRAIMSLMYQGLFAVDRDYNVVPILCKQYRISADMRTYTFYLDAATFSDGSTVTADDVLASLEAARESVYYSGRFLHVTEITLSEDGGISILLDTPMENLPLLLDIPILKAGQIASNAPLGTGPYFLDKTSGKALLRRRNNWWCKAEMTINAPAISLVAATSNAQIRDEFEFNDLSLVCANPGSDRYTDYRCDYELWDCENGIFLYLTCNMDSEVFSNPEIRANLTFTIDRQTIADNNYRGFGQAVSLPASPISPYYSQVQAEKYDYDGGLSFNQAVADAGMVGKEIFLLVNSEDTMRVRIANFIADALKGSGLVVTVKACNDDDYSYALRMREYDLFLGQTRLSPNMDLSAFFSETGALSQGGINDVGLYALCMESLANYGNYYTLYQNVMDDGRLCPILFSSYAIYATRGLLTNLTPARDNVFFYYLDKTMSDVLIKN